MTVWTMVLGALALSTAGLALAFDAWRSRARVWPKLAGTFLFWLASTMLWSRGFGAEIGIPLAIETGALIAFAFILLRAERRDDKAPRERFTPPPPPARFRRLRGFAKLLIGGPLAMMAAMGVGILIAVFAPLHEQTRLILAGLIVPSLWAALIVYTLMEARLWRSAGSFALVIAAGFGLTFLANR